jgi:hypothetical protein
VAGAWATYRFAETAVDTGFHFVFNYLLPDLGGADVFRRARFAQAIERAVELYVDRLVEAGAPVGPAGPPAE